MKNQEKKKHNSPVEDKLCQIHQKQHYRQRVHIMLPLQENNFYFMRCVLLPSCSEEVVERIISDNLFQYPTEKSVRKMALACLRRIEALEDDSLVAAIATQSSDVAKQICLYAMMKQYRLIWDFMITVIGEKYRLSDTTFGKIDLNSYFLRLQEQDDWVATWSDSTVTKLKQVIAKMLVENEYIDSIRATKLNPVWLQPVLENAIRENGDEIALPAFNCFS